MPRSVLVVFLLEIYRLSAFCMPKEILAPCVCSESPLNYPSDKNTSSEVMEEVFTTVTCFSPYTRCQMKNAIRDGLHRKMVDKVVLEKVPPKKGERIVYLPDRWLYSVRVKEFEIRNTLVAQDFISVGRPFAGQENTLQKLTIHNCYLSGGLTYNTLGTANTFGLYELPRLEHVDLSHNYLTVISSTAFRYPPRNLSTIILSNNSIRHVDSAAFSYVLDLAYLDLSHNNISSLLRATMASPARSLRTIDLSWNRLSILPLDFFSNMPSLKSVDMRNNFLFSLPSKPWETVWKQLTGVDLRDNFLECDCSMLWLPPLLLRTDNATGPHMSGRLLGECSLTGAKLLTRKKQLNSIKSVDLNC